MHDVAVLYDIFFSFDVHFTGSYQEKTVKLHNIRSEMNMFMYQFKIDLYNEKHKPVVEHLEWDEQIGDIFYVENGEDYYDENGALNKDLFRDNEDLFI